MTSNARRQLSPGLRDLAFGSVVAAFVLISGGATALSPAWTGGLLLALCLTLAAFEVRKRFAFLPLGPARLWLRIHLFGGVATVTLYFMHAGLSVPDGILNRFVWMLFVTVAGSGLLGAVLTRVLPPRLSDAGALPGEQPERRLRGVALLEPARRWGELRLLRR